MGDPSPSVSGQLLAGRYEVTASIGTGGMGAVLAANDRETGRRVAIKRLLPNLVENTQLVERFLREARAVAQLRNKHVAEVYDAGVLDDGCPYIAMELLQGTDLRRLVRREGPLPAAEAAGYVCQACVALAEAHRIGIVHRDLKPANLFVTTRADGGALVKVLDFGVAKFLQPELVGATLDMTRAGGVVGSRDYMAPEQLLEAHKVDARADVWSLGVVAYWLVSGQMPFRGTPGEVAGAICERPPASLVEASPGLPDGFESVVLRCLEKRREDRFASVVELARAFAPFARETPRVSVTTPPPSALASPAGSPPEPEPESDPSKAVATKASNRSWMLAIAALAVAAAAAIAWALR